MRSPCRRSASQPRTTGRRQALAAASWDLDDLGRSYQRWLADARVLVGRPARSLTDEQAFTVRSRLVHEWRKFLFRDPALPQELLPARWPGDAAAVFFDEQAERLAPGAGRFVDQCLGPPSERASGGRSTYRPKRTVGPDQGGSR